ncbi:MAG TPA: hypothetical protein VFF17_14305 [Thermoanaerobaculia bacterium]|nr:hypothetical protein [Thermoanaerobaculia bacterium]
MRRFFPLLPALCVALVLLGGSANAQEPEATPTPTPTPASEPPRVESEPLSPPPPPGVPGAPAPAPTPVLLVAVPTPTPAPPARVSDSAVVAILEAPGANPFGIVAQTPAALPPKLTFVDAIATAAKFVSVRVDRAGRPMGSRPERDPIPSLADEGQRSLARWTFEPGRKGAEAVETWGSLRLDLEVEIDAPRSVQGVLTPITPATPVPRPLLWPSDEVWLEGRKAPLTDGTVPLETLDSPPMPTKTPWDADSYKGPFSAKFWVKVKSNGIVEKAVPLEASDPVLIGYLRRAMSSWAFRPAQANGAPVDSWNELVLSGQVAYDVELKQIASLRRTLAGS